MSKQCVKITTVKISYNVNRQTDGRTDRRTNAKDYITSADGGCNKWILAHTKYELLYLVISEAPHCGEHIYCQPVSGGPVGFWICQPIWYYR